MDPHTRSRKEDESNSDVKKFDLFTCIDSIKKGRGHQQPEQWREPPHSRSSFFCDSIHEKVPETASENLPDRFNIPKIYKNAATEWGFFRLSSGLDRQGEGRLDDSRIGTHDCISDVSSCKAVELEVVVFYSTKKTSEREKDGLGLTNEVQTPPSGNKTMKRTLELQIDPKKSDKPLPPYPSIKNPPRKRPITQQRETVILTDDTTPPSNPRTQVTDSGSKRLAESNRIPQPNPKRRKKANERQTTNDFCDTQKNHVPNHLRHLYSSTYPEKDLLEDARLNQTCWGCCRCPNNLIFRQYTSSKYILFRHGGEDYRPDGGEVTVRRPVTFLDMLSASPGRDEPVADRIRVDNLLKSSSNVSGFYRRKQSNFKTSKSPTLTTKRGFCDTKTESEDMLLDSSSSSNHEKSPTTKDEGAKGKAGTKTTLNVTMRQALYEIEYLRRREKKGYFLPALDSLDDETDGEIHSDRILLPLFLSVIESFDSRGVRTNLSEKSNSGTKYGSQSAATFLPKSVRVTLSPSKEKSRKTYPIHSGFIVPGLLLNVTSVDVNSPRGRGRKKQECPLSLLGSLGMRQSGNIPDIIVLSTQSIFSITGVIGDEKIEKSGDEATEDNPSVKPTSLHGLVTKNEWRSFLTKLRLVECSDGRIENLEGCSVNISKKEVCQCKCCVQRSTKYREERERERNESLFYTATTIKRKTSKKRGGCNTKGEDGDLWEEFYGRKKSLGHFGQSSMRANEYNIREIECCCGCKEKQAIIADDVRATIREQSCRNSESSGEGMIEKLQLFKKPTRQIFRNLSDTNVCINPPIEHEDGKNITLKPSVTISPVLDEDAILEKLHASSSDVSIIHICVHEPRVRMRAGHAVAEKRTDRVACFGGLVPNHDTFSERYVPKLTNPQSKFSLRRFTLSNGFICDQTGVIHICVPGKCLFSERKRNFASSDVACPFSGRVLSSFMAVDQYWRKPGVGASSYSSITSSEIHDTKKNFSSPNECGKGGGISGGNDKRRKGRSPGTISGGDKSRSESYYQTSTKNDDWDMTLTLIKEGLHSPLTTSADLDRILAENYPVNKPGIHEYLSVAMVQIGKLFSATRYETDMIEFSNSLKLLSKNVMKTATQSTRRDINFFRDMIVHGYSRLFEESISKDPNMIHTRFRRKIENLGVFRYYGSSDEMEETQSMSSMEDVNELLGEKVSVEGTPNSASASAIPTKLIYDIIFDPTHSRDDVRTYARNIIMPEYSLWKLCDREKRIPKDRRKEGGYSSLFDVGNIMETLPDILLLFDETYCFKNGVPSETMRHLFVDHEDEAHLEPSFLMQIPQLAKVAESVLPSHLRDLRKYYPRVYQSIVNHPRSAKCPRDILSLRGMQLQEINKRKWPVILNIAGSQKSQLIEAYARQAIQLWCMIRTRTKTGSEHPELFPFSQFVMSAMYVFESGVSIPGRTMSSYEKVDLQNPDPLLSEILPGKGTLFMEFTKDFTILIKKRIQEALLAAVTEENVLVSALDISSVNIDSYHSDVFVPLRKNSFRTSRVV